MPLLRKRPPQPTSGPGWVAVPKTQQEALQRLYGAATPTSPSQAEMDELRGSLAAVGGYVDDSDPSSPAVTLAPPAPDRDEDLFHRTDAQWLEITGLLRAALAVSVGGRADRAEVLARFGALNAREITHLRYLATAATPLDSVAEGTEPITGERAKAIVAIADASDPRDAVWGDPRS